MCSDLFWCVLNRSDVICHMSYHMSNVKCHMSNVICQMSNVICHMSNVKCQTPRRHPWPPTACTGCSCYSGPSEASGNGPKWFAIPKNLGLKKIRALACSEGELLHEELLDLLQPIQAVLALQVHLRPLEIVPNDSPYPKTWGLKKNQNSSLLRSWVTPWRAPWPSTAHTGCSWPSHQSGASENGPKWFAIPKNLGLKKKSEL